MHDRHRYEALAFERLVRADLFGETDTIVIPVKTQGRTYGVLSRTVATKGQAIPELGYRCVELVKRTEKPDLLFLAFWDDSDELYIPAAFEKHVIQCTQTCVSCAGRAGVRRLALPLFGGRRGMEALAGMALGVELAEDGLDAAGIQEAPEVVFVTDREI